MGVTAGRYGDCAVRCVVDDLASAHRLHRLLLDSSLPGVVNVVPAWRTVVVTVTEPRFVDDVRAFASAADLASAATSDSLLHVLRVVYDGPDLAEVAALAGVAVDEVVARHSAPDYVVAFLGFAPGFPYLAGLDASLATPRLATPRQRVPAGSVGIAGSVTGIYPADSPGGWRIIGRVDDVLFDVHRTPPALLAPGDTVRFLPA